MQVPSPFPAKLIEKHSKEEKKIPFLHLNSEAPHVYHLCLHHMYFLFLLFLIFVTTSSFSSADIPSQSSLQQRIGICFEWHMYHYLPGMWSNFFWFQIWSYVVFEIKITFPSTVFSEILNMKSIKYYMTSQFFVFMFLHTNILTFFFLCIDIRVKTIPFQWFWRL